MAQQVTSLSLFIVDEYFGDASMKQSQIESTGTLRTEEPLSVEEKKYQDAIANAKCYIVSKKIPQTENVPKLCDIFSQFLEKDEKLFTPSLAIKIAEFKIQIKQIDISKEEYPKPLAKLLIHIKQLVERTLIDLDQEIDAFDFPIQAPLMFLSPIQLVKELNEQPNCMQASNSTNESIAKIGVSIQSTLATEMTQFSQIQVESFLKSESNSPFTQAGIDFILHILSKIAPKFIERSLLKGEEYLKRLNRQQKISSASLEEKESGNSPKLKTLRDASGFVNQNNEQLINGHALFFIQAISVCFLQLSQKEDSKKTTFPSLNAYLLQVACENSESLMGFVTHYVEEIILDSIHIAENRERTISSEWVKISFAITQKLKFIATLMIEQSQTLVVGIQSQLLGIIKPFLLAVLDKVGSLLVQESLFRLTTLIDSMVEGSKKIESKEKSSEIKISQANELSQIAYYYFRDYFMQNPNPQKAPLASLITDFMVTLISHCGPKIFLIFLEMRPKELSEDYKKVVIASLTGIHNFLTSYGAIVCKLTQSKEKFSEEKIFELLKSNFVDFKTKEVVRAAETTQINQILNPYLLILKQYLPNDMLFLFDIFVDELPSLILGFTDLLFINSVKIGIIHRLLEVKQFKPKELKVSSKGSKTSNQKLEKEQMDQWLKTHKEFSKQLGALINQITTQVVNIAYPQDKGIFVKTAKTIVSMLKDIIGDAILKEIHQVIHQDKTAEKLELIKNILWKFNDNQPTPTLSNALQKSQTAISMEEDNVKKALNSELIQAFSSFKGAWVIEQPILEICDRISTHTYHILSMEKVFRVFVKEYLLGYALTALPVPQKLPPTATNAKPQNQVNNSNDKP